MVGVWRWWLVALAGVVMVVASISAAWGLSVDVSSESFVVNRAVVGEMLVVRVSVSDGFGNPVGVESLVGELRSSAVVVSEIQGLSVGVGEFLLRREVAQFPVGVYDLVVVAGSVERGVVVRVVDYPPLLGFLYNDGVLNRGRVEGLFFFLGLFVVGLVLWLLFLHGAGK